MITITNNFHDTEYRTRKSAEEINRVIMTEPYSRTAAERTWVNKVRRALCGMLDCTCSGELGERGNQEY